MQGNVLGQSGGGLKIDEIIKEYQVVSKGKVSAGDFVKYVNELEEGSVKDITTSTKMKLITGDYYTPISAIKLSDNRVFILFYEMSKKSLYGIVCTINEDNILIGVKTTIITGYDVDDGIVSTDIAKLTDNKIFITYKTEVEKATTSGYIYRVYGLISVINDEDITVGTKKLISDDNLRNGAAKIVALSKDKVLIAYNSDSTTLNANVCTINDENITVGITTKIMGSLYAGVSLSLVYMKSNKILVLSNLSDFDLYGEICSVKDSSITVHTGNSISTIKDSARKLNAVLIDTNKIFITHTYNQEGQSTTNYLYSMVLTVTDQNYIKRGTETQISNQRYSSDRNNITTIEGRIIIAYSYYTQSPDTDYLYLASCSIKDDIITINANLNILTDNKKSSFIAIPIAISINKIFTIYYQLKSTTSLSYILNAMINYNGIINQGIKQLQNTTDEILGIAKTTGRENEMVQVYVPKTQ